MANLDFYNSVAEVPKNAQKTIGAGRLKGMTDINPMWRIQQLTDKFGLCGFGWKYVITDKRIECGASGVICAFVDIDLYIKVDGEWSEAIPGTGGSTFVASEKGGLYTSDECFKMALTDALSVACKALGFGANVYWEGGRTKYTAQQKDEQPKVTPTHATEEQINILSSVYKGEKLDMLKAANDITDLSELTYAKAQEICDKLTALAAKKNAS
jgi:hypothetical protein